MKVKQTIAMMLAMGMLPVTMPVLAVAVQAQEAPVE